MGEFRTPKSLYLKALLQFDNREYSDVLKTLESIELLIENTDWEPKAALLKAQVIGRLYGKNLWMEALENIILEYPNSKSAIKANTDLNLVKNSFKEKTKVLVEFKWVFPFKKYKELEQKELIESLTSNIENLRSNNWRISNDTYNDDYQFIVIHGIKSKSKALKLKAKLPESTLKLLDSNNFITLSSQYRKLFVEKAWPDKNYNDYE